MTIYGAVVEIRWIGPGASAWYLTNTQGAYDGADVQLRLRGLRRDEAVLLVDCSVSVGKIPLSYY